MWWMRLCKLRRPAHLVSMLLYLIAGLSLLFLFWFIWRASRVDVRICRRQHRTMAVEVPARIVRWQPKPKWVGDEVIRIKAWSPEMGCRMVAEVFNRQFAERGISVGKTWVSMLLRRRKLDVLRLRRELKHRIPRAMPKNRTWALDLTGEVDLTGRQQMILGVLDHGTRACLRLTALTDKSSLTILRELIAAFRRYGIPTQLRTDNEACFVSRTLVLALTLLGIQHQRTDLHCPWQNGRIERFFGTLKGRLDRILIADGGDLIGKLFEFRRWYNHVRPHQHLSGLTPAEAWAGRGKSMRSPSRFTAWDGWLTGWWFPS